MYVAYLASKHIVTLSVDIFVMNFCLAFTVMPLHQCAFLVFVLYGFHSLAAAAAAESAASVSVCSLNAVQVSLYKHRELGTTQNSLTLSDSCVCGNLIYSNNF